MSLQSVLNAAARSIAGLRRSAHIADTLASFHWLRASERLQFNLAVLVCRALHGTARHASSGLRTSPKSTSWLDVRPSCRVTVSDRSFTVAGPRT